MATRKENVTAIPSAHGEVIYELIGRACGPSFESQRHSVAYVDLPPQKSSLLHYHPVAEESYYILSGTGLMMLNDERFEVRAGDTILIKPTTRHQIFNTSSTETLSFLAICVPAWEPSNSVYV